MFEVSQSPTVGLSVPIIIHNMAEESKTSSLVPAHNCFNAETFFLHERGLILREAGVYLTLKELGNYLAMCQQVRRLMLVMKGMCKGFGTLLA